MFNVWNLQLCWLVRLEVPVGLVCPFRLTMRKKKISPHLRRTELVLVQMNWSQMDHLLTLNGPKGFEFGERHMEGNPHKDDLPLCFKSSVPHGVWECFFHLLKLLSLLLSLHISSWYAFDPWEQGSRISTKNWLQDCYQGKKKNQIIIIWSNISVSKYWRIKNSSRRQLSSSFPS